MKIETNKGQKASFYIARVGHVGKPMRSSYTSNNSFAVVDAKEEDYELVLIAYELGMFKKITYGSCQQYARIRDVRKVVEQARATISNDIKESMICAIRAIEITEKKLEKLKMLKNKMASQFKNY